jgi:hypothetical protein
MTQQRTQMRKSIYVGVIAALLIPLYLLSSPETSKSPGGKLARERKELKLSETDFGEIDPASSTARLATLGMRGVAVVLLWEKSQDYQKRKLWTELAATTEQIMKLEPHYVSVWENQAWNLSYNVSAEFDDYKERYRWVRRGVEFGKDGCDYNTHSARLPYYMAWIVSQKIGRADEKTQFRELFREDDEFHDKYNPAGAGAKHKDKSRDNWIVGKEWYHQTEELYDQGAYLGNKSRFLFYASKPKCQMSYAEAREEEGSFGEGIQIEWEEAETEWWAYGNSSIFSMRFDDRGEPIKYALNDYERFQDEIQVLQARLDELAPGRRAELQIEKWDAMTPRERGAILDDLLAVDAGESKEDLGVIVAHLEETSPDWRETLQEDKLLLLSEQQWEAFNTALSLRTEGQQTIAGQAEEALWEVRDRALSLTHVAPFDIALSLTGEARADARQIDEDIDRLEGKASLVQRDRDLVTFEYWLEQARLEQAFETREARRLIFEARRAYYDANPLLADELYLQGLEYWRVTLSKPEHELMRADRRIKSDMLDLVDRYSRLLDTNDSLFPEDFPLYEFVHEEIVRNSDAEDARRAMNQATTAIERNDMAEAETAYRAAIISWAGLYETMEYLQLMADPEIGRETLQDIYEYVEFLEMRAESQGEAAFLSGDFPLTDFVQNVIANDEAFIEAFMHTGEALSFLASSELAEAQAEFELAIEAYATGLDRFNVIYVGFDPAMGGEIRTMIEAYDQTLELRGTTAPEEFPLQKFRTRFMAN